MNKDPQKLFYILGGIILIISIFLWREINNFRSISTEVVTDPIIAEKSTPIPITAEDQILGNPGAPLTIIEYIDLNDSKSKKINSTIISFVNEYPLKARAIFKHSPVPGFFGDHDEMNKAAWCAGKQKKLWEFLGELDPKKGTVKISILQNYANKINLNIEMWKACVDGDKSKSAVESDVNEAKRLGLGKPPLIFVNNKKLNTDLGFDLKEFLTSLVSE